MESSSSSSSKDSVKIRVKYGASSKTIDATGKTVGQVRTEMATLLGIPKEAKAFSGTREVADDEMATDGMNLEYVKKTGEKG
jgi:hypothetical protein